MLMLARWAYGNLSYPALLSILIIYAVIAIRAWKMEGPLPFEFIRENWKGFALSLAVCIWIFSSVPHRFRVLNDETNLLGVSWSLTFERSPYLHPQAERFFGHMQPVTTEVEKRPLLFPFLLHFIHLTVGYSPANAFALNGMILFIFLALSWLFFRPRFGPVSAAAAVIFIGANPLIALCSTSGSMDLLSVLLFFSSSGLLIRLVNRSTPASQAFFIGNLILFSYTRYESPGVALALLICAVVTGGFKLENVRPFRWFYFSAPLLFIPWVSQRIAAPKVSENHEWIAPFSLEHFVDHSKIAVGALFDWRSKYPYPVLLNWISLASIGAFAFYWKRGKWRFGSRESGIAWLTVFGLILTMSSFYLAYYLGRVDLPVSARYFLIPVISLAAAPLLSRIVFPGRVGEGAILGLSLICAVLYHPLSVEDRFTSGQVLLRQFEATRKFLNRAGPDKRFTLIFWRPELFTPLEFGAVGFKWANENHPKLMDTLSHHLYREVFVVQRFNPADQFLYGDDFLDPAFRLEKIEDVQTSPYEFLRFSKVVPL